MKFKSENIIIKDSFGRLSDKCKYVHNTIFESVNYAQRQLNTDFSYLNIVVETYSVNSLEEWAIGAALEHTSELIININPLNENFHDPRFGSRLRSQTLHECHHIARMKSKCWKETFGDDLILEGMADAFELQSKKQFNKKVAEPFFFAHRITGNKLSPLEERAIQKLDNPDYDYYDYKDWFVGYKSSLEFPPQGGHSLGLALVTEWLQTTGLSAGTAHSIETSVITDWWRARHEAGYRLGYPALTKDANINCLRPTNTTSPFVREQPEYAA